MSADAFWRIRDSDGELIIASALLGQTPTLTRGSEQTLTFRFSRQPSSGDYGEDAYSGGAYGGLEAFDERYRALRAYLDFNGAEASAAGTDYRAGRTWYREDVPPAAPIDTFVVAIEPTEQPQDVGARGFWAIVLGGTDQSGPAPAPIRVLEVDVFILADLDDFSDHDELEAALAEEAF